MKSFKSTMLYIVLVILTCFSFGVLYFATLSQFIFPDFQRTTWEHLLILLIEIAVIVLISVAEQLLIKHGLSPKALSITMILKCVFSLCFLLFCFFAGSWKGMDLLWLLLTFLIYWLTPLVSNKAIERISSGTQGRKSSVCEE